MDKKGLSSILNGILKPLGFKKKGDSWVVKNNEIIKTVNLQKSRFSNSFYVNYGYILNSIPLNGLLMHVFNGLGSMDNSEQQRITALFDLENDISDEDRAEELRKLLSEHLVPDLQEVYSEKDVLKQLKNRPHLYDIPLIVKKHFCLE